MPEVVKLLTRFFQNYQQVASSVGSIEEFLLKQVEKKQTAQIRKEARKRNVPS